jgi:NAD(P)-dependent dehydrogenase (short-subunit alcohol dehydrogenase family)
MSAGKTVLITGSSTGIGRATAELFQSNGWQVVATMRNPGAGKELAELDNVLVQRLDVTDEGSIHSAVTAAVQRFGSIDVLVNNAGYGAYGILEATSIDSMRQQFETNVIGLLAMTKAVVLGFRSQGNGVIVNVSSIGGRLTLPFGGLYSGSKFAVEGISEAIGYEMREIGVRVKLVEPGIIKTNFANAMEFSNDISLREYQRLVDKLWEVAGSMRANGAEAVVAAEVIYTAATDGTDQLRYTVGEDAKHLAAQRDSQDDSTFFAGMRTLFGQ